VVALKSPVVEHSTTSAHKRGVRRSLALGLLFGLCALAGCGGTTTTVTQSSVPAQPSGAKQKSATFPKPKVKFCTLLETQPVCEFAGVLLQYAPRDGTLQIKGLTANLVDVRATSKYLVVTLKITNTSTSPEKFAQPGALKTVLAAGGEVYKEAADAEKNEPDSFVSKSQPIQPGASQTATVSFAVPHQVATNVINQTEGGLFIGSFGVTLANGVIKNTGLLALKTQ